MVDLIRARLLNIGGNFISLSSELIYILISDFFMNPRMKYKFVERFDKFLPTLIPIVKDQLKDVNQSTSLTVDDVTFDECYFPEILMAKKILAAGESYDQINKVKTKGFEISQTREDMLKKLNPV